MRAEYDYAMIECLLVHFLSAARTRPPRGNTDCLVDRIPTFWLRVAEALAFVRLIHRHDDAGEIRTAGSIRRICQTLYGPCQNKE